MKRRTLLLLPAGLLLAACTTLPEGVRERRGRFSLQKTGYGAPEQFTGRFTLRTGPGLLRLDILTPLSGVIARIESTPHGATISRGLDEVVARGDSPEGPSPARRPASRKLARWRLERDRKRAPTRFNALAHPRGL